MMCKPNAFQKRIHRFLMLRPVTASFASWIHRVDKAVLRLTRGRYTVSALIGWDVIQLTTTGARSGQPRSMPLVGLFDGEKIALIASGYGRKQNPAWYYNLKADPQCTVEWKGRTGTFIARETDGDEYDKYWQMAVSVYEGYEMYKTRAGRRIPVMVLEPKK